MIEVSQVKEPGTSKTAKYLAEVTHVLHVEVGGRRGKSCQISHWNLKEIMLSHDGVRQVGTGAIE